MKLLRISLVIYVLFSLTACIPDDDPFLSSYEPILIERSEANRMIKFIEPQEIEEAGKFYIYRTYLLFIEKDKGIHVYDNIDPEVPINLGFITVINISDLAITNDILYVNQSIDLVAIDVSDLDNVRVTSRIEGISGQELPPDGYQLQSKYSENWPDNTIVAEWKLIDGSLEDDLINNNGSTTF